VIGVLQAFDKLLLGLIKRFHESAESLYLLEVRAGFNDLLL
jgi:hypothetical protein